MERKGLTLIELLVVIVVIMFLTGTLTAALHGSRQTAIRLICETNLTGIGRAMTVYAGENEGQFPRAGREGGVWTDAGVIRMYHGGPAGDEDMAFGIRRYPDGEIIQVGNATITSSFYLLVKYLRVKPKQFVCKGDAGAQELKVTYLPPMFRDLSLNFDFGSGSGGAPYPGQCVSYAYHLPNSFSQGDPTSFAITDESHPASPVCADRNPYLDRNAPDDAVNSACHLGKGQNVLYKDGSVRFERSPTVGIGQDNIYMYEADKKPTYNGEGFPADDKDAYLVGECNFIMW